MKLELDRLIVTPYTDPTWADAHSHSDTGIKLSYDTGFGVLEIGTHTSRSQRKNFDAAKEALERHLRELTPDKPAFELREMHLRSA